MASKRRLRRNACTGKRRFAAVAEGKHAIGQLFRKFGYRGHMDVYRCKFCNAYHIGHAGNRTPV